MCPVFLLINYYTLVTINWTDICKDSVSPCFVSNVIQLLGVARGSSVLQSCYRPALGSPSTVCELVEISPPDLEVLVLSVPTALYDKSHLCTNEIHDSTWLQGLVKLLCINILTLITCLSYI